MDAALLARMAPDDRTHKAGIIMAIAVSAYSRYMTFYGFGGKLDHNVRLMPPNMIVTTYFWAMAGCCVSQHDPPISGDGRARGLCL